MTGPLVYILAPFGLAFALFAAYLVVSLFLRDPARPFRMFAAGPALDPAAEAETLLEELEGQAPAPGPDDPRLARLTALLQAAEGPRREALEARARHWLPRPETDDRPRTET